MGTTRHIQNALNSGEMTPRIHMREDYERYANGCKTLRNFQPLPTGGVTTQYGQQWIAQTKDGADAILIPFEFSTTQAYMIEAGTNYFRFYKDGGRIYDLTGPVATAADNGAGLIRITDVAHGLTTGNYVYITGIVGTDEANGEWIVTVISADTFDLQGSTFTNAYTSGGTWYRPYQVTTTYSITDLKTLKWAQSADTLYLVHPSYAPRKLTRTGHTSWTLSTVTFLDGPYMDANTTTTSLTPSAATMPAGTTITNAADNGSGLIRITAAAHGLNTGDPAVVKEVEGTSEANGNWIVTRIDANNVDLDGSVFVNAYVSGGNIALCPTLTASHTRGINNNTGFQGTDVGRMIRIQQGTVWGYVQIVKVTSTTVVRVNIVNTLTSTAAKKVWRMGAFSGTQGYPSCVTFFEQRLCFGATALEPSRMWLSTTGSYEDFSPSATSGTVSDSDAVTYQLGSNRVNKIQWMAGSRQLFIGTAGEEFSFQGANYSAVSATDPPVVRSGTTEGSANLPPVRIGNRVIFIQRSLRELREMTYADTEDSLVTEEVSLIAEHLLRNPRYAVTMAYQNKPNRTIWVVRDDGLLLAFCNYVVEKVRAWALMGSTASSGLYKWVAVIPSVDLLDDQAWFIMRRTVNGVSKYFVEMQNQDMSVHCGLTYSGAAISTVSGLDHLNGETVKVVGDGAVYDDQVVARGSVDLAYGASLGPAAADIQIGLALTPNPSLSTLEPVIRDQSGSGRDKRKHWASIAVALEDTVGLTINGKTQIQYRTPADPMDSAEPTFTGTKQIANLGWSRDGELTFEQTLPLPATILGYSGELDVGD